MITVFVFGTKHKVKVTPKVAAKRKKGNYEYDVLKDKRVRKKREKVWPYVTKWDSATQSFITVRNKAYKPKKVHPVEKNPRLQFFYPSSKRPEVNQFRDVRVIGANAKYVVGLQINDKNKFKKFLKAKMRVVNLAEFSPESVS